MGSTIASCLMVHVVSKLPLYSDDPSLHPTDVQSYCKKTLGLADVEAPLKTSQINKTHVSTSTGGQT